ncbi:transcriptional antiterminator, BglG family [Pelagirhabdus alkalitolerans]|uniref:Transcriptional antiterminator, BglG family n=1 Tax=Pelagirhabdus alkalitolerans TaxID=1612202 RepID=A0A1G6GNF7_9BACI|nr:PRD domain-containing protein [Pelagirhabdus alkalitolerans]SDB83285.1 transcriptional antiterminator, BglG family [Pelagirhabdus alkalitolerans]
MEIKKVLNNNVVITMNEHDQEMVVMGKGLAFQKRPGEVIDPDQIEKTFILQNLETSEKLNELLKHTSEKYLDISSEILAHAQSILPYQLDEYLYVALTDHISFAISRYEQGIELKNNLLYEVRKYYKKEFEIAQTALDIIQKHTGARLPEDDAGSIALHLVNSQISGENMQTAVQMTDMVNSILNIVKYYYQMDLDESSINYERFVTHLRYFSIRFVRKEKADDTVDDFLHDQVMLKYQHAYACTERINLFLEKNYNWSLSQDEKVYLTVHIHRVTNRHNKSEDMKNSENA